MYVLGINGSPRIGGNTDILLDEVLAGAKSKGARTAKILLCRLKYSPCLECGIVSGRSFCIVKDDMELVYRRIKRADAVVLASPIFFGTISAQMKMMIDRFQCVWRSKYMLGKDLFSKERIGIFISVEASERQDFFKNAKSVVKNLFATINAKYTDELFCTGVEAKGEIRHRRQCLKQAYRLGQKIVR